MVGITEADIKGLIPLLLCAQFVAENPDVCQKLREWVTETLDEDIPMPNEKMSIFLIHTVHRWMIIKTQLMNGNNLCGEFKKQ
jgi:hypothetical protein